MNSYDTKTWAWEAQINALKSELEIQAANNRKLRAALEKINVGEGWAAQIARAALGEEKKG